MSRRRLVVKRSNLIDRLLAGLHPAGHPGMGAWWVWPTSRVCTSGRFSPWLHHDDGTGGVAADRRRRPAQEDIEKAAFAMRAKDQAVDPQCLGGGDDQLAWITHL